MLQQPRTAEEQAKIVEEAHASYVRQAALKQKLLMAIRVFLAENPEGILAHELYDYIILFDAKLLHHCEERDIERVLRHELRHTWFDSDSKNPYRLIDHDFQDFYAEVELNTDDPGWANRLARTLFLIHEREKAQ